jgi:hypothetical protein
MTLLLQTLQPKVKTKEEPRLSTVHSDTAPAAPEREPSRARSGLESTEGREVF